MIWTITHTEFARGQYGKAVLYRNIGTTRLGDNMYLNLRTGIASRRKTKTALLLGRVVFVGQNLNFYDLAINSERILRTLFSGHGNPARIGENFTKERIKLI